MLWALWMTMPGRAPVASKDHTLLLSWVPAGFAGPAALLLCHSLEGLHALGALHDNAR